jgi:hypothetical protein
MTKLKPKPQITDPIPKELKSVKPKEKVEVRFKPTSVFKQFLNWLFNRELDKVLKD